ncbi:PER1 protein-like protein of the endoplasmic reticulum [Dipodascopsis tothii]|uniref:PER1 protein-like protein of the endoplasmic reticulum n=1 Tax=Dipodascopsis tothii TaxID=44089 RepID=UPI0034CF06E3
MVFRASRVAWTLAVIAMAAGMVQASVGDRLPEFRKCVRLCAQANCYDGAPSLPLYLRLTGWTCERNCDYDCQLVITEERVARGASVEQFHGKWPFQRVLGMQEPASVLFSLMNFWPHYRAFGRLGNTLQEGSERTGYYMKAYYLGMTYVGMNAWFWSSVFHFRDFVVTERLDYFSAAATVLYGFFFACVRTFRLDRPSHAGARHALAALCLAALTAHVGYLSLVHFSYTYNMAANVAVGVLHNVLWVVHGVRAYWFDKKSKGAYWALWPIYLVLTISVGMSLELFDFPPILGAVDAHSLWHLVTVLPSFYWYRWVELDAASEGGAKRREE